ncbi:ATP phosphoribosyltransferase regulatory subunit [Haliovirga abyssi]|uniref:ATP phosphoribosyltransferase regulatory subunit n=1 Tax=Haliovirga abyssi TaxID=2996794 RepID=A0AAU9DIF0_9FUSO|nr:ATP phosphoribosyltransferase regulatory subunit [Haliovirga abyssi]BDU49557.1 ATP phosphoribosyltransferase regulatory subunit [Haliovirga abyssi]
MALIPKGVKVYFGNSLKKKLWIENSIRDYFEKNYYNYIELPVYEYYDDIKENFSEDVQDEMFKFLDRDSGKILTLRPDMTSLLSKLIKLKKEKIKFPERIYYIGDVFRHHKIKSGVYREIAEAGVELIGGKDKDRSDLEIAVMAIELMKKLGLKNAKLEIGTVNLFKDICKKVNISNSDIKEIKKYLSGKDITSLSKIVKEKNYDEIILKLPSLIGKKDILKEVEGYDISEIEKLTTALDELGYENDYIIDLGIVRELEYYTGIVFNGLVEGYGDYILSGGRYDELMGEKAIGFVLKIDSIFELLEVKIKSELKGYYIYGSDYIKLMKKKKELLLKNEFVEISAGDLSESELKEYVKLKGFKYIYNIDTDEKISLEEDENDK